MPPAGTAHLERIEMTSPPVHTKGTVRTDRIDRQKRQPAPAVEAQVQVQAAIAAAMPADPGPTGRYVPSVAGLLLLGWPAACAQGSGTEPMTEARHLCNSRTA